MNKTALQDHITKLRTAHGVEGELRDRLEECRSLMLAFEREESLVMQQFEHKLNQPSPPRRRADLKQTGVGEVVLDQQLSAVLSRVSFVNMIKKSKLAVLEAHHRKNCAANYSPALRVETRGDSSQEMQQKEARSSGIEESRLFRRRDSSFNRNIDSLAKLKAYDQELEGQLVSLHEENENQQMTAEVLANMLEVLVRDKGVLSLRVFEEQWKLKKLTVAASSQPQMDFSHKLAQVLAGSSESN